MELFDFIASREQELEQLRTRRFYLQGQKAGTDPYSKRYRLLGEELKHVEVQLTYKEREVTQYVERHS